MNVIDVTSLKIILTKHGNEILSFKLILTATKEFAAASANT